ncbi:LAGLIDADG family homing endonuclease [Streptomyces anulatus]|uniref:LAGLIDADG family homing endonuclease n=1 Tax=Streptomyces anulatus TaxID=1892 RepID=UPI0034302160
MRSVMTPVEAAWVAGLFEGEGCITWTSKGQAGLAVTSTDYDVIERLALLVGLGSVVAKSPRTEERKPYWIWKVGSQEDFLSVAEQIEPFLLSRRSARLREVRALLAQHQERVAARRAEKFRPGTGICRKGGHDRSAVGVTTQGHCAECDRIRNRTKKAKAREAAEAGVSP